MFLDKSRYAKVEQEQTETRAGRPVTAIKLRRLAPVDGDNHAVKDNDRLDLLAHASYGDGTRFWHIADANTALQANELVAETGAVLKLPRS